MVDSNICIRMFCMESLTTPVDDPAMLVVRGLSVFISSVGLTGQVFTTKPSPCTRKRSRVAVANPNLLID